MVSLLEDPPDISSLINYNPLHHLVTSFIKLSNTLLYFTNNVYKPETGRFIFAVPVTFANEVDNISISGLKSKAIFVK